MSQLQISTEQIDKAYDIYIIRPDGLVDLLTAPDLESCIEDILAKKSYNIIIDMKKTNYISSAGWGIFIALIRNIRESNGDLVFVNVNEEVRGSFNMLELSSKFNNFSNIEDAVSYFKKEK
ncbi:MAG: STAS domain-containing protein [Spirochaetes bacterium]|nr:STAS domain-containing protein [Spirochaetota bacterium]MCK5268383.1 STAS domain-containing protein [Spirochaetota bacterium]